MSCRFDNSRGAQPVVGGKRLAPRYVLWGEGTTDEMCLGLLQVATRANARRLGPRGARASRARGRGGARRGLPAAERSRQVARTTGQFLFALVAPQADCEVLEIGGSRGYSTIWLAAGARQLGGRVLSLESDPRKIEAWRATSRRPGLEEWAELVEGDAHETLPAIDDVFDVVFLDAEKEDYEALFALARGKVEPGALFVADNVLSHADPLAPYSAARQADPTLGRVTVPLDRGPRAERRLALDRHAARFAILLVPRKGGGPAVISSSTGSGGTSG